MKKSLVLASLLAASTSMFAMDLQYFLGAGAERGDANYKVNGSSSSGTIVNVSDDMTDTTLKLKAGIILDKTHRISVSHANFNGEDTDLRVILGNYDYLIPINNEFRLLAGVHVGNGEYKETNIDGLGTAKISGLVYGAQVGAIYDITKNIEFELGLAYSKYNMDKTFNWTDAGDDITAKIEIEDSTSMFAGINYKF